MFRRIFVVFWAFLFVLCSAMPVYGEEYVAIDDAEFNRTIPTKLTS